jgi:hypothetical protein
MIIKPAHSLSQYRDGYAQVAFCTVCFKEADELATPCYGEKEIKRVDKDKE